MKKKDSEFFSKTLVVLLGLYLSVKAALKTKLLRRQWLELWRRVTKGTPRSLKKYKIVVTASAAYVDDTQVYWGADAMVYQRLPIKLPGQPRGIWIPAEAKTIDLEGDISLFFHEYPLFPDGFEYQCENTGHCAYSLTTTDYSDLLWNYGFDIEVRATARISRDPFPATTVTDTDHFSY